MNDWRKIHFDESICEGEIKAQENGNILVKGNLKNNKLNVKIKYWAANPPEFNYSFSGSGLPFPNEDVAFDNTPNRGAVIIKPDNSFSFKVKYCKESIRLLELDLSDI